MEASLVHRLGSESVSDPVLSVLELVKNSYDADAEEVAVLLKNMRTGNATITVTDNGTGMTERDLIQGWMRVSTTRKAIQRRSKRYNRRMLGQKGIGRFAVESLSQVTTITSYPENKPRGFRVTFDWDRYASSKDLFAIPNSRVTFKKEKKVRGLVITLQSLPHRWLEKDVKRLRTFIQSLTPPAEAAAHFESKVIADEFAGLTGIVESTFLQSAVFVFESTLTKTGEVNHSLWKYGDKKPVKAISTKFGDFTCGPVDFKLHFYYREKSRMKASGVPASDIDSLKNLLDDYGGIKVYRDGIRLSGFGNPDDDWTGLDAASRNEPSVVPARNQIIATVGITGDSNPEINDTTSRENIIKNTSFQDLLRFVKDSISVFSQMRAEVENKRTPAPKKARDYVLRAKQNIEANKTRAPLLDFATQYPSDFYDKLEEEINTCYLTSQPNATLLLCRKVVENLLYEILFQKFPKNIRLRYDGHRGRALDFSVLIENLETHAHHFNQEQRETVDRFLELVKGFKRDANATAHKIIQYLDTIDELAGLKVREIIQLEISLLENMKVTKRATKT